MFRIDTSRAVLSRPASAVPGTPGYFTNGDPATGYLAIQLDGEWFNGVQENLMQVLAAGGIAAVKGPAGDVNLRDAIFAMIDGRTRTVLTNHLNLYVSPSGNDADPGTVGAPFLTIQAAINYIYRELDLNGWGVYTEATCLIATEDEGYTYNRQINRLSTIQEHNMIRQAIAKGLSPERIGRALDVNVSWIREKQGLLRGIAAEVVELLKDRQLAVAVFSVLRKMKPLRQIEVAELMIAANRLTVSYARALLAATPKEQLAEPEKPKAIGGVSAEAIARMEAEMDHLQRDYRLIEDGYGTTILNLVVAKGYIGRLLTNDAVARYLDRNYPEMKRELEGIIAAIRTDAVG